MEHQYTHLDLTLGVAYSIDRCRSRKVGRVEQQAKILTNSPARELACGQKLVTQKPPRHCITHIYLKVCVHITPSAEAWKEMKQNVDKWDLWGSIKKKKK